MYQNNQDKSILKMYQDNQDKSILKNILYIYNPPQKLSRQLRKKSVVPVATSNLKLFLKTIWWG